jgi:O-antigen/teichoic acid export membrane protein
MFLDKIVKLYISKFIGVLIGMLSYLVVIPKLTNNPTIYGIYSVTVSLMIFLQYADLGFLGAGQKYAAESFAKNERQSEIKILGFVHFILLIATVIFSSLLFLVYLNPNFVFKDIGIAEKVVAKKIILIFILFSPLIVFQRLISAIFLIRLEDFVQQYIEIIFNTFKILSVFYFFTNNRYELINYLLFIQILNILSVISCLIVIKKRYCYDFNDLFKAIKFNKEVYGKTKKMAKTSIFMTLCYFIYYDLDLLYVSKLYGTSVAAKFAIGVSILTISKTLMNIFFSPFQVKFNHLRGIDDENKLFKLFLLLIDFSIPICVLPIITIILMMRSTIIHWVGFNYIDSIIIAKILIFQLLFNFILMPVNYLIMAKEQFKLMLILSGISPIIYFILVFILGYQFGYLSIPLAKSITILVISFYSLYLIKHLIGKSILKYLIHNMFYLIPCVLFVFISLFLSKNFWDTSAEKQTQHLVIQIFIGAIISIFSISMYYLLNSELRKRIFAILKFYKK